MDPLVIRSDPDLHAALDDLARDARLVFFAGLPGTGKSLLIHQLAHLAHARGRGVHLLQWDVARPVFEAGAAGRRYPQVDGVTHGVIRIAVGRWARAAVARWHREHPRDAILIGETPFIGHRLIELARPIDDDAEPVLTATSSRFVIPVPSRELRAHLEAERARRTAAPLHEREREDAPPSVLRDLWREVVAAARRLGIPTDGDAYDPIVYQRVYERLLAHRHATALPIATRLPTARFSAYDFHVPTTDVVPAAAEAATTIADVDARYPDARAVEREIAGWDRGT